MSEIKELINEKDIQIFDRKVIKQGRGKILHVGFIKDAKLVRLYVKQLDENTYKVWIQKLE